MEKKPKRGGAEMFTLRKILRIMRITFFLVIVAISSVFANDSYAQHKKLSLKMTDVRLGEVLDKIEKESQFYFLANQESIDLERLVDIDVRNQPISSILDLVLEHTNIRYTVIEKQIVLTNSEIQRIDEPHMSALAQNGIAAVHPVNTMDIGESAFYQVIRGTVIDEGGQPLPGVNVLAKGTTTGTQTDFDGNYSINVPNGATTLVFSFIGLKSQEIAIDGKTVVNVTMIEDATALDEVVLVGYGAVKRSDLTGSVASISSKDISEIPTNTVSNLLQGRAAGVQVTTGDGSPGGGINIRIRGTSTITGSTEPLYIVDGFPVNSDNDDLYVSGGLNEGGGAGNDTNKVRPNALSFINPNDIANIEILKDAAATAIYGSRGANGVVLITTKRGNIGKTKLNLNYSTGVQTIIRKIETLDGPEYVRRYTEREINGGVAPQNVRFNGSDKYHPVAEDAKTFNYQDLIYRPAITQDIALAFTGGNEKTKYLLSGKYVDQQGIMVESGYRDAQIRVNLDQKLGDFIDVKTNLLLSRSINKRVPAGAGFNYNTVTYALGQAPIHDPEWFDESTGLWYTDSKVSQQYTNPLKILQDIDDQIFTNRLLGNVQADFRITKSLTFTGSAGIDYSDATRKFYQKRTLTYFDSPVPNGQARINGVEAVRTNTNGYFTWTNSFGDHNLNVVGGVELISQTISNLNVSIEDFATDELGTENLGGGNIETAGLSNGKRKWQTVGFFGRMNYDFKSKYYASVNVRQDGSSVFGASNKWGFFPSLALAWRPTEEDFLKDQDFVSNLKLRASIGQTGNGSLDPYSAIGLWTIGGTYSYDDQIVNRVNLSRISNPDLKWETTTQYNVGLDARFLNGKLGFTFDYYLKDTEDLILPVVIPKSTGFDSSIQNLGELRNTGLEFGIDAALASTEDFSWNINANVSHIESKATNVGEGTNIDPNTQEPYIEVAKWNRRGGPRLYEGQPAGQIYGYVIEGVFRDQSQADNWPVDMDPQRNLHQEGFYIYKDINGDGIITDADQESLGTGQPDYIFGLTNRFKYKAFDLSLFLQGTTGSDIVMFYSGDADKAINSDFWTPDNRDALVAVNSSSNNSRKGLTFDNRQIQDGSYLRLKNIRLGYTFPDDIGLLGGLNIYLNASNLLTLTTYDGYNPDVNSGGGEAFSEGFDAGVYPLSRTYTLGLNFNF
ncbi:TonB-dependent receptor [Zobellia galactanivorans]|uniref:TonB-dependent receptor n=1 Tax=Zobellia galactanivorans (strain DSM 12802 / CCUG 47099 / CIP 106680 / NCIMB 13871 / Dsij) TaxID=63186 RepID=UPI0026E1C6A5|nr:TonB-dependent receptor [Zobellia galactanivorans]MDO6809818.1 TonB-dependent receptor [Zobellia galactanivorans]